MKAAIKIFHSDVGGEYMSTDFMTHLGFKGIVHRLTIHDTPEENGIAECLNQTLLEWVRAMLHSSSLPKPLWAEAVKHAVWLKNQSSTRALDGRRPYEVAYGKKPNLVNLPEWGTKVYVHLPKKREKLSSQVHVGYWVGYNIHIEDTEQSQGHQIYWKGKQTVTAEQSVIFATSENGGLQLEIEGENADEQNGEDAGREGDT